jgi:beta-lactamase class A
VDAKIGPAQGGVAEVTRRELLAIAAGTSTLLGADDLDGRIRDRIRNTQATVCLYARNLETGATFGVGENERVSTASTIKLPIMTAIFQAVEDGRAKWTEQLTLRDADKVSGSGVLREFSDGARIAIPDLVHLMIVVSDNTATNLLLDRFPADSVNAFIEKLGLKETRSLRKIRGDGNQLKQPSGYSAAGNIPENRRFGIGVSTPREMVTLLDRLEKGEVVSPAASKEMIAVLKRQQDNTGIRRRLGGMAIANKTGALDHLRSDVGIVYSPQGRIAIAVTVTDIRAVDYSPDNPGSLLIADLAPMLVEGLGKTAANERK